MKSTAIKAMFVSIAMGWLAACGQSSGSSTSSTGEEGETTTKSNQSSTQYRYAGLYKLDYIQATDLDYWDTYRFDIASGDCQFTLTGDGESTTGTWYVMNETNECFLEDEWGQQFPMIGASKVRFDVSNYGSVTDVDSSASDYTTENTSTATITAADFTFGSQSALIKLNKDVEGGYRFRYDYFYDKQ